MSTVTISGAGNHASAAATDRVPASKASVKGYLLLSQIGTYMGTLFAAIGTTISAAGLATGGGSLAANRTITVTAATAAETRARSSTTTAITPANLASRDLFSALLSANQTGIANVTYTLVAMATESIDVGGNFDNSGGNYKWTPQAGPVRMNAAFDLSGALTVGSLAYCTIFKNGSAWRTGIATVSSTTCQPSITAVDVANGTDYYQLYVFCTVTGTATLGSASNGTYFMGEQI